MGNRIVVLGGGIGGLSVARALRFVHADLTIVDREQRHTLPSQLYSIATGQRRESSAHIRNLQHGTFVHGEAVWLDTRHRRVLLADRAIPYDVVVVATGTGARYPRNGWEQFAPSPKSVAQIRAKLQNGDTAVVVGGGVTGVELAAAVARADRSRRVILADEGDRLLRSFPETLASDAHAELEKLGVEVRLGLHSIGMDAESVRFSGPHGRERISSRAVLWAGGVEGSSLGAALHSETRVPLDEIGRVCVNPDLTIPGHPEIFVIGDLARSLYDGLPLDGLATVASQQARYVASSLRERMAGYTPHAFEYVDQGRFVLLGRRGFGLLGDTQLRGHAAWLAAKLAQRWSAPTLPSLAPRFEMRAFARW